MLDAPLDFLNRHAVGLWHLAAVLVDDVLQFLRHARRAVHHQVAVGKLGVNLFDPLHRQHIAVRLAAEFVSPVAGANCHRQSIDSGRLDKPGGFVRIGQQLVMRQHSLGPVPILSLTLTAFE